MSTTIVITICCLLILAYLFDLTSSKTKIPSVILLLLLGWTVRQVSIFLNINIPDLTELLPVLGTIGLIMIVLDGSLELEFNKSKLPLIIKSVLIAFFTVIGLGFIFAYSFNYFFEVPIMTGFINAIPLCIISSAIAIPSVKNLSTLNKDFVIYESSLSDVFGIMVFNFFEINNVVTGQSFVNFGLLLLIIIVVSFIAIMGLGFVLNRVTHQIKFAPIIILIILIYEICKEYNIPALIFILLFGLFLGNLDKIKQIKGVNRFNINKLEHEVTNFREIIVEGTFLIRALFFLLFGYLMETSEILNSESLILAGIIVAVILVLRLILLAISKLPITPLVFIAPRGLITILLFLSIAPERSIPFVNQTIIIQIIIITALIMMIGLMFTKNNQKKPETTIEDA